MATDPDASGKEILGMLMQGGELQRLAPNSTLEQVIGTTNDVIDRLNGLLRTQIFADDQSKRMLFGYQKDGWGTGKDFGIKISKEGIDVTKATDDQLLFKMDLETWFWYDPDSPRNHTQIGILPNGKGGVDVARDGNNVADAY
jgi:hypothetical protein